LRGAFKKNSEKEVVGKKGKLDSIISKKGKELDEVGNTVQSIFQLGKRIGSGEGPRRSI